MRNRKLRLRETSQKGRSMEAIRLTDDHKAKLIALLEDEYTERVMRRFFRHLSDKSFRVWIAMNMAHTYEHQDCLQMVQMFVDSIFNGDYTSANLRYSRDRLVDNITAIEQLARFAKYLRDTVVPDNHVPSQPVIQAAKALWFDKLLRQD